MLFQAGEEYCQNSYPLSNRYTMNFTAGMIPEYRGIGGKKN
jgi:hypothetical protein